MTSVPMRELRNNTADVLRRVQAGDEVTITQNGVPVAALTAIKRGRQVPLPKAELLRLLDRRRPDPTLISDIAALTDGDTDDLGSIR